MSSTLGFERTVGHAAAVSIAGLGITAQYREEALKVLSAALLERNAALRERAAAATFRIHVGHAELDAARALLTHSDPSCRIGALRGLEWCVYTTEAKRAVAPLRGDVETIEEASWAKGSRRDAAGEIAREMLNVWGTPDDLLRTARTRMRRAIEISVEDDRAALTPIRRIVENGLRIDQDHRDLLALLGELWIRARDLKEAQPVFARLVELEPKNPKHRTRLAAILRGDIDALEEGLR